MITDIGAVLWYILSIFLLRSQTLLWSPRNPRKRRDQECDQNWWRRRDVDHTLKWWPSGHASSGICQNVILWKLQVQPYPLMHWIIPDHTIIWYRNKGWQIGNNFCPTLWFCEAKLWGKESASTHTLQLLRLAWTRPWAYSRGEGKLGRCKEIHRWPPLKRQQKIYMDVQFHKYD